MIADCVNAFSKQSLLSNKLRQKELSLYYMWKNFDVHFCLDEFIYVMVTLGMMQRKGKGG